jgi:hypothetical protein
MLKGKVLFNAVFTTVKTKKSSILLSEDNERAFILPEQKVVAIGKHVEDIKVGDTVLINVEAMGKKVPIVTINGEDYISITERHITYVFDKEEIEFKDKTPA